MGHKMRVIVALVTVGILSAGCVPVAIGAAGVVVVDKVIEKERSGDGLF